MVAELKKERFSRKKYLASKEWSAYQQALFDWGLNGTGHGLVEAFAGAAKSTSLVGLVASLPAPSKIAVVAFNVHSVSDLSAKMPSSVSVSTAHKFGMSALFRYFGEPFKPNDEKSRELCRRAIADLIPSLSSLDNDESGFWLELASGLKSKEKGVNAEAKALARSMAAYLESVIHFAMASLCPLDADGLVAMEDYFCIEYDFPCEIAHKCLLPTVKDLMEKSTQIAIERQDVSLDELLYLPVKLQLNFPAYDFVLQDEAQDASNVMLAMIERMAASGRLISVADRFQSIQGFTGAAADSVDRIIQRFTPTRLPLSICYRCPTSHLDLARRLVPGIQSKPDAILGEVNVVSSKRLIALAQQGDLIICRFTAPLVSTCLQLIKSGINARVRGRDIGVGLVVLTKKVPGIFPGGFIQGLQNYCKPRIAQMKEDDRESELQALEDRMLAVMACFDSFGQECRSVLDFGDRITKLFCDDDDHPPVTLATIHRSKGDEADRVWIIGCDFLPYTKKARHEWQIQQELNLTYVALTRAKQSLFLVPLNDEKLSAPLGGMDLPSPIESEPIAPSIAQSSRTNSNGTPNGTYPLPQSASILFQLGQMVVFDGNPRNACKILAIDGDTATVQRGTVGAISKVALGQLKSLIPV